MFDFETKYRERMKLLSAKNPKEFIELMVKSKLSNSEKAYASHEWKRIRGYTAVDLRKARSKNKSWKLKQKKYARRYRDKRLEEHNYLRSASSKHKWNSTELQKFYKLNSAGKTDAELAKIFRTSIPAVYSVRRKFSMAKSILIGMRKNPTSSALIEKAIGSESNLRLELRSLKFGKKK